MNSIAVILRVGENGMKSKHATARVVGVSMVMGICFGSAFGSVFGSPGQGSAFGLVAGIVVGTALSRRTKGNTNSEDVQ